MRATTPQAFAHQQQQQQQQLNKSNQNIDAHLKHIQRLESEFDILMKQKQQLDNQLAHLPYMTANSSMHEIKKNVENELELVEKKLASYKMELRKLNAI